MSHTHTYRRVTEASSSSSSSPIQAELAVHKKKVEEVESWLRVQLDLKGAGKVRVVPDSGRVSNDRHLGAAGITLWFYAGRRGSVADRPVRLREVGHGSRPGRRHGLSHPGVDEPDRGGVQEGRLLQGRLRSRCGRVPPRPSFTPPRPRVTFVPFQPPGLTASTAARRRRPFRSSCSEPTNTTGCR